MEKGLGRYLCVFALATAAQLAHGQTLVAQDDVIADRLEDAGLFTIQPGEILGNDQLPAGVSSAELTIIAVDSEVGGSAFLDDGLQFRTPLDYFGPASFRYTVQAPDGQTSSATVTMTIAPVNDPPSFITRDQIIIRRLDEAVPPTYPAWFFGFDFGGGGEDDGVAEFIITVADDPNGVVQSASASNFGTLMIQTTGNIGTATLEVRLRDDGGTLNGGNDLSDATTILFEVTAVTNLRVTKSNGLDTIRPGALVTYFISVVNESLIDLPEVRVQDEMPPEYRSVFWSCTGFADALCGAISGVGDIDEIVNLPMNGEVVYTVSGVILGDPGTLVVNTATATGPEGLLELTPGDNSATDADPIGVELFKSGFEESERPQPLP
ncbi:MAG: hypothetical protein AAGE01_21825 [Pseudomonadota bacterium]